jgi:hypothetical protein
MSDNLSGNSRAFGELTDIRRPVSILCREIGLAAVAMELNLELRTLEPDVAGAIERGAAALFDAGYGPSLIGRRRSDRAREKGSGQKAPRRASKPRQSRPSSTGKGDIELRHSN